MDSDVGGPRALCADVTAAIAASRVHNVHRGRHWLTTQADRSPPTTDPSLSSSPSPTVAVVPPPARVPVVAAAAAAAAADTDAFIFVDGAVCGDHVARRLIRYVKSWRPCDVPLLRHCVILDIFLHRPKSSARNISESSATDSSVINKHVSLWRCTLTPPGEYD